MPAPATGTARRVRRQPTRGEDLAITLRHGFGRLLALVALPFLVLDGMQANGSLPGVGASVFGVTMVLAYLTSTLYHAFPQADRNGLLRRLDHSAIYQIGRAHV